MDSHTKTQSGSKHDKITIESEHGVGSNKTKTKTKTKGNFLHYQRKKKKFFYEDILKKKDGFFNIDVGTECDTYFRGQQVKYKESKTDIFYHVVDLDAFEYHKVVFHTYLNAVLQSAWFR